MFNAYQCIHSNKFRFYLFVTVVRLLIILMKSHRHREYNTLFTVQNKNKAEKKKKCEYVCMSMWQCFVVVLLYFRPSGRLEWQKT